MKEDSSPYQIMASILKPHQVPTLEQAKKINSFFFCRWLSNNRFTIPISALMNRYYNIPPETQLKFAQDYSDLTGLPGKVKFIGFTKEKQSPEMIKILDNIKRKYKVNDQLAQVYFDLMDNDERDKIYSLYDVGLQKGKR